MDALLGRKLRYHALWPCTVAAQTGAELDLVPDDDWVKGSGLVRVKLRHGLPGFTCVVPAGTRVLLGFEAGDPTRPYATLWDEGAVTSLTFDAGSQNVARVGDDIGLTLYLDIAAPALYYWDPNILAWFIVNSGVGPPGAPPPAFGTQTVGTILTGNPKFDA
jgi:hypothetical protein